MRVSATDFRSAEETAYDLTSGFLSVLSFHNDVPLEVAGYQVTEESTGEVKGVFGMLGRVKAFVGLSDSGSVVSDVTYRRIFAAYREGLNATNVFYQALNFAKAIEGCRKLRQAKNAQAVADGLQAFSPDLEFPASLADIPIDEHVKEFFIPFLGKKLTNAVEHFRPLVRNAIAHLDPFREILDIDRFKDVNACERSVPVLRYVARRFVMGELEHP